MTASVPPMNDTRMSLVVDSDWFDDNGSACHPVSEHDRIDVPGSRVVIDDEIVAEADIQDIGVIATTTDQGIVPLPPSRVSAPAPPSSVSSPPAPSSVSSPD